VSKENADEVTVVPHNKETPVLSDHALRRKGAKSRMPQRFSYALLAGIGGSLLIGESAGCVMSRAAVQPPTPSNCEAAVVSPVTGYAECVHPRGASVDPPPPRPDEPCSEIAKRDTEEARYCRAEMLR
jgi:hypothetical protein